MIEAADSDMMEPWMSRLRETLETRQIAIYFAAIILGGLAGILIGGAEAL